MALDTIYEEDVPSKWITRILTFTTAVFALLFVRQLIWDPGNEYPAVRALFLILFLFFVGLLLLFRTLAVRMTADHFTVAYGPISYSVPLEDITDVRADETSAVRYGGAGIRLAPVGGKLRLVFSVIGGERVIIGMKDRRIGELVFSTNHPDKIMNLVMEWTGLGTDGEKDQGYLEG